MTQKQKQQKTHIKQTNKKHGISYLDCIKPETKKTF